MVNGKQPHLYSSFLTSGTHSHTDGGVNHAGRQPARQEQYEVNLIWSWLSDDVKTYFKFRVLYKREMKRWRQVCIFVNLENTLASCAISDGNIVHRHIQKSQKLIPCCLLTCSRSSYFIGSEYSHFMSTLFFSLTAALIVRSLVSLFSLDEGSAAKLTEM